MSPTATTPVPHPGASIRRAEAEDYAVVSRLYALVHSVHAQHLPAVFQPTTPADFSPGQFEACLNDDSLLLLAERGREVAGSLHAVLRRTDGEAGYLPGLTMFIVYVVTDPAVRRSGVASALIAAAAEWAAENDAMRIELAVWSFNAEALALYRKLGFDAAYTGMTITPSEMLARHGAGRLPQRPGPGFVRGKSEH
jgi:ribosomal protein S18 acetylase RimI-like enzyme